MMMLRIDGGGRSRRRLTRACTMTSRARSPRRCRGRTRLRRERRGVGVEILGIGAGIDEAMISLRVRREGDSAAIAALRPSETATAGSASRTRASDAGLRGSGPGRRRDDGARGSCCARIPPQTRPMNCFRLSLARRARWMRLMGAEAEVSVTGMGMARSCLGRGGGVVRASASSFHTGRKGAIIAAATPWTRKRARRFLSRVWLKSFFRRITRYQKRRMGCYANVIHRCRRSRPRKSHHRRPILPHQHQHHQRSRIAHQWRTASKRQQRGLQHPWRGRSRTGRLQHPWREQGGASGCQGTVPAQDGWQWRECRQGAFWGED